VFLCVQMLAVLLASIRIASMLPHEETLLASVQGQMLLHHIVDPFSPRFVFRDLEPADMTAAVRKCRSEIYASSFWLVICFCNRKKSSAVLEARGPIHRRS